MVAVAQLVESRIVIPVVVGSSPISHPNILKACSNAGLFCFAFFHVKSGLRKIIWSMLLMFVTHDIRKAFQARFYAIDMECAAIGASPAMLRVYPIGKNKYGHEKNTSNYNDYSLLY